MPQPQTNVYFIQIFNRTVRMTETYAQPQAPTNCVLFSLLNFYCTLQCFNQLAQTIVFSLIERIDPINLNIICSIFNTLPRKSASCGITLRTLDI